MCQENLYSCVAMLSSVIHMFVTIPLCIIVSFRDLSHFVLCPFYPIHSALSSFIVKAWNNDSLPMNDLSASWDTVWQINLPVSSRLIPAPVKGTWLMFSQVVFG
mmetsp:Transcript_7724/g.28968  ORF Transcript_7724/g.28968 Transcript_7724/m.28968 type:complete len:104 (-) Transcript_7724:1817-2128(-)